MINNAAWGLLCKVLDFANKERFSPGVRGRDLSSVNC